jgi:hypothetical protein
LPLSIVISNLIKFETNFIFISFTSISIFKGSD